MTDTCRDLLDQVEPKDLTQIALQMLFTIERMELIIPEITDTIRKALEQAHPAIQPVPVSERPWEREGWCNDKGECWHWDSGAERWELIGPIENYYSFDTWSHSLPHHALPTPEATDG